MSNTCMVNNKYVHSIYDGETKEVEWHINKTAFDFLDDEPDIY